MDDVGSCPVFHRFSLALACNPFQQQDDYVGPIAGWSLCSAPWLRPLFGKMTCLSPETVISHVSPDARAFGDCRLHCIAEHTTRATARSLHCMPTWSCWLRECPEGGLGLSSDTVAARPHTWVPALSCSNIQLLHRAFARRQVLCLGASNTAQRAPNTQTEQIKTKRTDLGGNRA